MIALCIAGVTVGLTWPVFADQRHLFGIMGLEVEAVDLMESVTYFTHPDKSTYAFLINSHGMCFGNISGL